MRVFISELEIIIMYRDGQQITLVANLSSLAQFLELGIHIRGQESYVVPGNAKTGPGWKDYVGLKHDKKTSGERVLKTEILRKVEELVSHLVKI